MKIDSAVKAKKAAAADEDYMTAKAHKLEEVALRAQLDEVEEDIAAAQEEVGLLAEWEEVSRTPSPLDAETEANNAQSSTAQPSHAPMELRWFVFADVWRFRWWSLLWVFFFLKYVFALFPQMLTALSTATRQPPKAPRHLSIHSRTS